MLIQPGNPTLPGLTKTSNYIESEPSFVKKNEGVGCRGRKGGREERRERKIIHHQSSAGEESLRRDFHSSRRRSRLE